MDKNDQKRKQDPDCCAFFEKDALGPAEKKEQARQKKATVNGQPRITPNKANMVLVKKKRISAPIHESFHKLNQPDAHP
jgi:hypothetical protein